MKRRTIFSRVFSLLLIVLVFYLVIGIMGLVGFVISKGKSASLYNDNINGIIYINDISKATSTISIYFHKVALGVYENDQPAILDAKSVITENKNTIQTSEKSYEASIFLEEERALFNDYKEKYKAYINFVDVLIKDCESVFDAEDKSIIKSDLLTIAALRSALTDSINEVIAFNEKSADENNDVTQNISNGLIWAQIILLGTTIPIMMLLAFRMLRSVEMELKTVAAKLIASAGNVESAATQLNEASDLLAMGSSRNAAAIEQTSATMNESSSMISQNAENTRHAAQLAHSSNEHAMKGKAKMDEMVHSMEELKESSDTISKIIKTIDDIAFQTNLLAINATVEAARAGGESGRSFSVVADEVRTLAQRSQKAAADTEEIIERNIALTNSSREVSHEVARTLDEITMEFENLNKIIDEINAASEEQASGIKQINQAISQMEKTTQENAAVAEENAATANSMKDEIGTLNDAIEIQKSIIRDPSSINGIIANENKSGSPLSSKASSQPVMQNRAVIKPANTFAATPKISKPASFNPPAAKTVKPSPQPQSTDAEKIIPLDDDDDF